MLPASHGLERIGLSDLKSGYDLSIFGDAYLNGFVIFWLPFRFDDWKWLGLLWWGAGNMTDRLVNARILS